MKKIGFAFFLLVFVGSLGWARQVSKEEATIVANNYIEYVNSWKEEAQKTPYSVQSLEAIMQDGEITGYVARLEPKGFIILSNLTELSPFRFMCFSADYENLQGNVMLKDVLSEISIAKTGLGYSKKSQSSKLSQNPPLTEEQISRSEKLWHRFEFEIAAVMEKSVKTVGQRVPGLTAPITWNQFSPFNDNCPELNGQATVVGCDAMAMSIIMNYWNSPNSATGSVDYYWTDGAQNLSIVLEGHTYDWSLIKDDYQNSYTASEAAEVAKLCRDAGYATHMQYNTSANGGSSSNIDNDYHALINNFQFDGDCAELKSRLFHTDDSWYGLIVTSIDNGEPIEYRGFHSDSDPKKEGGHAFVVDGYDSEDGKRLVHLNLGWGGYHNGDALDCWYTMDNIEGFSDGQHAIFGLKPVSPTGPHLVSQIVGSLSVGSSIYMYFDRSLDMDTVTEGSITLIGSLSGTHHWNNNFNPQDLKELILDPTSDFEPGETVTVTILSTLTDTAGYAFDGDNDNHPGGSYTFDVHVADVAPIPAQDLTATVISNNSVQLDWTGMSSDEDGFLIERRIGTNGDFSLYDTVGHGVTTYQDGFLAIGVTYCYRVKAYKGTDLISEPSNEACATVENLDIPTAPGSLSAVANGPHEIDLSWVNNASNASSIRVFRQIGWNGTWYVISELQPTTSGYIDNDVAIGITYNYKIQAVNSSGTTYSNIASATPTEVGPAAPSNLVAVAVESTKVRLTWKDNADNEEGFNLESKVGVGGTWKLIKYLGSNETTCDVWASADTEYYFRIYAHNAVGNSGYSNVAGVSTCVAPEKPYLSDPYNGEDDLSTSVLLEWWENDEVSTYDIYLDTSTDPSTKIGTVSGLTDSFQVDNLQAGQQYYWKLIAHASCDSSKITESNVQTFYTVGNPSAVNLVKPSNEAVSVATSVVLDWDNVTSAGSVTYDLYLSTDLNPAFYEDMGNRTEKLVEGLSTNTTYYWKVVAKSYEDPTLTTSSATWSFTTGTSSATTITIKASKDAGLRAGSFANSNYGGVFGGDAEQRYFGCGNDDSYFSSAGLYALRGVLYFDLSSVPSGVSITNATLTLAWSSRSGTQTDALTLYIDPLTASWNEGGITWNNCPTVNTAHRVEGVVPLHGFNPTQNDITPLIESWVEGIIPNYGMLVSIPEWESVSAHAIYFAQREEYADQSTAASLQVTYQQPCPAPSAPALSSPSDGALNQPKSVNLSWSAVSGVSGYKVYFGTSTDPQYIGFTTDTAYEVTASAPSQQYYWRVESVASCDASVVTTSSTRNFTTSGCLAPDAAVLTGPDDDSVLSEATQSTLSWNTVAGAGEYEVYLDTSTTPSTYRGSTSATSLAVNGLVPDTNYFWFVRAKASCDDSLHQDSEIRHFKTAQAASVTADFSYAPGSPRAGAPIQFSDTSSGPVVSWQWDFGDGAHSTQKDPMHVYTVKGSFTITLTVSNGAQSSLTMQSVHVNPEATVPSDFSGDGKSDILWRNYANGVNSIWLMDGTSKIGAAALPMIANTAYHVEDIADFDGDGDLDILWRNHTAGYNLMWIMNGTSFESKANIPMVTDLNWEIQGTGDFNGDGKADILWRNYANGVNSIWLMDGTSKIGAVALPMIANTAYHVEDIADFDGDGDLDILWRNHTAGYNLIWIMNGTSFESKANIPMVTDLNWEIQN